MKKKQGIPPHLLPSREEVGSAITLLLSGCSTPDTYERYLRRTNWRVQGDYAVLRQHFPTPCSMLDFGAVPPLLATLLSFQGWTDITVADPKANLFQKACEDRGIQTVALDLLKAAQAAPDRTYDLVCCCEVLEHLTGNILVALKQLSDFVAPGKFLYLTTPNLRSVSGLRALWHGSGLASKYKQSVRDQYARAEGEEAFFGHVREYTDQEIVKLVSGFGYAHVASHYQVHPRTETFEDRMVQFLERRIRDHKMGEVDGIERSSKQTDTP